MGTARTLTVGLTGKSVDGSAAISWSLAEIGALALTGGTLTGATTISNTTASTTITTGALIVSGGTGIGGALNVGGDVTAYATSDARLKTNIVQISDALNKVCTLTGNTFNWNSLAKDKDMTISEAGVIAQEVESVLPEVVTTREDGYMAVRYEKLVPLLIEAIKELKVEIDMLKGVK